MRIETRPVKGAGASGSPVFAEAVDTLDDAEFRVILCDGRVSARLVVPGANVAPGRLG